MSTTYPCPCCQTDFTPSVSAETAEKDSIQNMFDCPHCQSVLKWEHNTIKIIHKADPEEPQKLDVPVETTLQKVPDSTTDNEQASNEITNELTTHSPDIEQPLDEPNDPIAQSPLHINQPVNEPDQPAIDQPDQPTEDEINNTQFEFNEAHPEEELEQKNTNVDQASEPTEEEPSSSSQTNFNLSHEEEELIASSNTPENFSDVEDYGNSETSTDKGFLHYDITIKGIDSVKIEQQVLSVLKESRFNWIAKEILSLQKDGALIIKKLNPVKAMCLISELSFLPVTLSWKQYMAIAPQVETADEEQPLKDEPTHAPEEDI